MWRVRFEIERTLNQQEVEHYEMGTPRGAMPKQSTSLGVVDSVVPQVEVFPLQDHSSGMSEGGRRPDQSPPGFMSAGFDLNAIPRVNGPNDNRQDCMVNMRSCRVR